MGEKNENKIASLQIGVCASLPQSAEAFADILILGDGTIFIHNLTPALAKVLNKIQPQDSTIQPRVFEIE